MMSTKKQLLDIATSIVMAEEIANRIKPEVKLKLEQPQIYPSPIPKIRTRTKLISGIKLLAEPFLYVEGTGTLKELLVKTEDNDLVVDIEVDGEKVILAPVSWLYENTDYISEISVDYNEDEDYYIIHISDIKFSESIRILLRGDITYAFCKWEEVVA